MTIELERLLNNWKSVISFDLSFIGIWWYARRKSIFEMYFTDLDASKISDIIGIGYKSFLVIFLTLRKYKQRLYFLFGLPWLSGLINCYRRVLLCLRVFIYSFVYMFTYFWRDMIISLFYRFMPLNICRVFIWIDNH